MHEEGKQISELLRQTARLYKEIATLLVAADDIMGEKKWTPRNTTCITGSNAMESPEQWFAQTVHRFYVHAAPEYTSVLTFVSVLLCDSSKPELVPLPLLSAGWLDYGPNGNLEVWDYWYSRFHIWMPNAKSDGVARLANSSNWPKWKVPFARVATLAVPLDEVSSTEDLGKRIVSPLLAHIDATIISSS